MPAEVFGHIDIFWKENTMPDFPWNNFGGGQQPEQQQDVQPVEPDFLDSSEQQDVNVETVGEETQEPVEESGVETGEQGDGYASEQGEGESESGDEQYSDSDEEPDEDADDESDEQEDEPQESAPASGRGKRVKKNGVVPTLDRWATKKIIDCYTILSTEQGAAAAKTILGAGTSDPATLLAQLSEKKNRKRVAEVAEQVKELTGSTDTAVLMMNLALAFSADKELAKSVFGLLNAIDPDKGFGRSSGDPRKDAKAIAEKWGDGVDLDVVNLLRL